MTTKDPTHSKELHTLLEQAREDTAVLAVILFGSAARGEATPASDVDVCLVLEPWEDRPAAQDPSTLARKRVEYLHLDLDVKLFQQLPLYVRHRVLKEGRVLFVRDTDRLYAVAFRAAQAFGDFSRTYREYLEAVARGGS